MDHENKIEVLQHIETSIKDVLYSAPWLIVCHPISAHEWASAVDDIEGCEPKHIGYRAMVQLHLWLDSKPEPHIIIVDEYDPGLRGILQELLPAIKEGGHRLFMARSAETSVAKAKPQQIKETLDFMKR